jgi:hypothetical protein
VRTGWEKLEGVGREHDEKERTLVVWTCNKGTERERARRRQNTKIRPL